MVAGHVDQSGADAKAGLAWTFLHAGARKLDGNPHEKLSDPARAAIQADIDALHDQLVGLVARNRRRSRANGSRVDRAVNDLAVLASGVQVPGWL